MPLTMLYDPTGHPLLIEKFLKLKTQEERDAQVIMAQLLLNLRAPAYTGDDADELVVAVVRQVNFQVEQGLTPAIMKSVSNTQPGTTTAYRDRYVEPGAWSIVQRVTKVATVGFTVPGPGV